MTKIEQEYAEAKQVEVEAAKRHLQAMEAVNSALRLLAQAEDALLVVTKEHAQVMERTKVAAEALAAETSARLNARRIALAFPEPSGVH